MISNESRPVFNFLVGMIVGVGTTFLYIRFGIELPAGPSQKLTKEAIVKTAEAELFNSKNSPLIRRRALAIVLANKPDAFLEVDQAINNQFFDQYIQKHQPHSLNGTVILNSSAFPGETVKQSPQLPSHSVSKTLTPHKETRSLAR